MRRVRFALIVALTCATAVACTSADGNPSPTPSFSTATLPSYSVSTEPTSPPVTSPSVATTGPNVQPGEKPPTIGQQTDSDVGAAAFARFWIATLDWAYATMDSSLARAQFLQSCGACRDFLQTNIEQFVAKDEHIEGGRVSALVEGVRPGDGHYGATSIVEVDLSQGSFTVINRHGTVVHSGKQTDSAMFRIWMRWHNGAWSVVDFKQVVTS